MSYSSSLFIGEVDAWKQKENPFELYLQPLTQAGPEDPKTKTLQPYVTGTSILGIKFEGGVLLAGDTLGSYGSLARFRDLQRFLKVGENTLIGASGDYSDFQYITELLGMLVNQDKFHDDGAQLFPREIYSYLKRVMYNRRSKYDPLWNQLIVCGIHKDDVLLGQVDLQGTWFEDGTLATGYGAYIAQPLLRKAYESGPLSEEQARRVLEDCMRVLFYRDARTINKIQFAKVTAEGVEIAEPVELETYWYQGEAALGYPVPE